jgi:hypothetical protein
MREEGFEKRELDPSDGTIIPSKNQLVRTSTRNPQNYASRHQDPKSNMKSHSFSTTTSAVAAAVVLMFSRSALSFVTSRAAGRRAFHSALSVAAKPGQAEVILVGCGAPNRGMGWYHGIQVRWMRAWWLSGVCAVAVGSIEDFELGCLHKMAGSLSVSIVPFVLADNVRTLVIDDMTLTGFQ